MLRTIPLVLVAALAAMLALTGRTTVGPVAAAPPNDNLADAIAITTPTGAPGIVAVGDSTGAGPDEMNENNPSCRLQTGSTVWYTWTSPGMPGTAVLDTLGASFDTVLGVYTGNAFPLVEAACNDDSSLPGFPLSALQFSYLANTTYRIQLGGFNAATGPFVLSMSLGAAIYINDTSAFDTVNDNVNALEAVRFASGTLGRALTANEANKVLNAGGAGVSGADLIHFNAGVFPPSAPVSFFPGAIPVTIADLTATNDTFSAVGAGAILDGLGLGNPLTHCLEVSGTGIRVEGLQVTGCSIGIVVDGNNNLLGGSLAQQRNRFYSNTVNFGMGAVVAGSGNQVVGSYFGTNADGTAAAANNVGMTIQGTNNTVGGTGAGQGNLVSGNTSIGVFVQHGSGHVVQGNRIGTNAAGTGPVPNGIGVQIERPANTLGGSAAGAGNLISGNPTGVYLNGGSATGNLIKGNKIGTNGAGSAPISNGTGVHLASAANNSVGGPAAGDGNTVAYSAGSGVKVDGVSATGNQVRGNSIYSNNALGIDNTTGGNLELSPPAVGSVTAGQVQGLACPGCTVDVYNDDADEGRVYLGSGTANGAGVFAVPISGYTLDTITATAVDVAGNTSEFSAPFAAPPNADGDGAPDASDGCPNTPEDVDQWDDGDGCPDADNDGDGVCDVGQVSVSCSGSDSGKTCFDPAGTLSCPTTDCRNMAEDVDAFKDSDGCPEPDNDNDGFADVSDQCPGADLHTGVDGMLGPPQDVNHNGVRDDPPEALFTTDDQFKFMFEDYDTVLDNDGCHDSPGEDFDGDGYTDDDEALEIGTNAGYPCGGSGWPSDLHSVALSANKLDLQDVLSFVAPIRRLDSNPPGPPYDPRWDLNPGSNFPFTNHINITDITTLVQGPINPPSPAYPTMFGGLRAFGRFCPLAAQ